MTGHPGETPARKILYLAVAFACIHTIGLQATEQVALTAGTFFEAEAYDGRPWYSDDAFGKPLAEPLGSGDTVLIDMWKPGALSYMIDVPEPGNWHVWMRCAVPEGATVRFGANTTLASDLQTVDVAGTTTMAKLAAEGAYKWRKLGAVALQEGANTFLLGQGAQRPDCFFLTRDEQFVPDEGFLAEVHDVRDAPEGRLLPELRHERQITEHPSWLTEKGLRPAYAHFEWDRQNTPQSWARMAKKAGASCLVGVGEIPAGTLNGKMKPFSFRWIDDPNFSYPEGYLPHDHSWVREFVDAGHAEGLKVVMYGGAFRTLDPILVEHPEWRQQDAKGNPYGRGFGSWHSPYRQAYIQRWVHIARKHGIDGIMVDMLFTAPRGGDYSPYTVRAFRERFGIEPPRRENPRDLTWQRWVDFQTWTREEVMLDVTEALHNVNPEIACIWNQTRGWVFSGREYLSSRAGQCADGLLEEMGWEVSHGTFTERPMAWPLQSAWQSLFLHCRTAPGYGQMWHLNGFYTRVNHEALSFSMFANGIAPAVVTGGNWAFMTDIWDHIRACESYMTGATLMPYAALHFSENTLQWVANANGDEARKAYLMSVFGIFQALLETHLPVSIITDDDLEDPEELARHACIVLPNSGCLSDRQVDTLTGYVENGGGLVAAFNTGVYDENGTRRRKPALQDLTGVTQLGSRKDMSWTIATTQTHDIVSVPEVANGGEPSQGARDRKPFIQFFRQQRSRTAQIVKTTAAEDVDSVEIRVAQGGYSALHTRTVGTGRVAYFPPDVGHGYFTYNHPIARLLIERTVRWTAQRPPPFSTDAPLAVQTVGYRRGNETVIHLVNDNSSFGRSAAPNPENFGAFRDEVLPIYNVELSLRADARDAKLLPAGDTLTVTRRDGTSHVRVPKLDIHAMVVFR